MKYDNTPDSERLLFKDAISEIYYPKIHGIEIGVLNGDTSAFLLSLGVTLTGIDPIVPDSMDANLIGDEDKIIENTFKYGEKFRFFKCYSYDISGSFLNNSYDFLFIDGDHTYEAVKKDYELYYPKIKIGGLIFFHDSRMNRGGAPFHVGPSKFVDEVILNDKRINLIGETFSLTCFKKWA